MGKYLSWSVCSLLFFLHGLLLFSPFNFLLFNAFFFFGAWIMFLNSIPFIAQLAQWLEDYRFLIKCLNDWLKERSVFFSPVTYMICKYSQDKLLLELSALWCIINLYIIYRFLTEVITIIWTQCSYQFLVSLSFNIFFLFTSCLIWLSSSTHSLRNTNGETVFYYLKVGFIQLSLFLAVQFLI